MATCWESSQGLPSEIKALFKGNFAEVELLLAIPEFKVALPGGRRESQNDLFCLLNTDGKLLPVMIEGKVEEPFDRTVSEWLVGASPGKLERLSYICNMLGLSQVSVGALRYQLLHRTVSAIITSRRFGCARSAMIVHSFSAQKSWFHDFKAFVAQLGISTTHDRLEEVVLPDGHQLFLGWASGSLEDH